MSLNRARILSSENDASVKQDQNTNINIKISRETGPIRRSPALSNNVEPYGAHEVRSPGMSDLKDAQPIVSPKRQYIPGSEGGSIQTQRETGPLVGPFTKDRREAQARCLDLTEPSLRENNANFTIPQGSAQCGMTDSVYQYQPTINRDAQLESALTEPALHENNELEIKINSLKYSSAFMKRIH